MVGMMGLENELLAAAMWCEVNGDESVREVL
jgi:hypothetical protein